MESTLAKMIDRMERGSTWRNLALAVGGLVPANLAVAGYILPNIEARRPEAMEDGFLVMIDLAPLRSAEDVYRIYDLYTPDILGWVRLLYALDFVIPLLFAFCVGCLIARMLRYLAIREGAWRVAMLAPFAAFLFDGVENALSLFLLGQYQDGQVFPMLARVAGVATAAKFIALGCSGLATLVLLVRTVIRRVARRAGGPRGA